MPFPIIPLVAAAAPLVAGGINALSQRAQNRRSESWANDMYEKQKQDNISFWNMQNEYNSPQQQMERLRGGGLNPALVYGGSSGGMAGTAQSISTPDVQQVQRRSPDWGNGISAAGAGYLSSLYDFEIKQAQVDNLRADNTVKLSQAALLAAQTSRSEFDLGFESELRDISASARRESLRKLQADTDMSISENERRTIMNSQSVQESMQRILSMRISSAKDEDTRKLLESQKQSVDKDIVLKQLDIELRRAGISPQDPMWTRILVRVLTKWLDGGESAPKSLLDKVGGIDWEMPEIIIPKSGLPYMQKKSDVRPHNVRP